MVCLIDGRRLRCEEETRRNPHWEAPLDSPLVPHRDSYMDGPDTAGPVDLDLPEGVDCPVEEDPDGAVFGERCHAPLKRIRIFASRRDLSTVKTANGLTTRMCMQ